MKIEKIEEIIREHFYPGPISGSTKRLAEALQKYLEELQNDQFSVSEAH